MVYYRIRSLCPYRLPLLLYVMSKLVKCGMGNETLKTRVCEYTVNCYPCVRLFR